MRFEVRLPGDWAFRAAGVDVPDIFDLWHDVEIYRRRKLPVTLGGQFFLSDPPTRLKIKVLAFRPHRQVVVDIADEAMAGQIRQRLRRYSVENDGAAVADREHAALWAKINKILERDGLSYEELRHKDAAPLTPRAVRSLMQLCKTQGHIGQANIYRLFDAHSVPRSERVFVARWLVRLFEATRDPDEEIPLWDLAVPEIAEDLIRLIRDRRRYGDRRWTLCLALAKTKHPRAADVIAAVLGQGLVTRGALEALGKLPAQKHVGKIRKYLRDADSDVRREAKKTLKKLGFPVEAPPPVHLVKKRQLPRTGLEEWSQNLDLDELAPTLDRLAKCVSGGFAKAEVAEVLAVAEEMEPDQTRAFCFPVTAAGQKRELWIAIFMDDVASPDLSVHAHRDIMRKFQRPSAKKR